MLARRVTAGAVVLAVCAGFQVVGQTFPDAAGESHEGLGLLDVDTVKGSGSRAVGEVLVEVDPSLVGPLPVLTGFENHGGVTTLRDGTVALGRVVAGVGNGDDDGTEGAVRGHVVGTYLHGPVLARNPALADCLLSWALATLPSGRWTTGRRRACARSASPPWGAAGAGAGAGPPRAGRDRRSGRRTSSMRTVLNLLWLVLSGVWLAIGYAVAGLVLCILIITIPFGVACFRLAAFVLWPFGRAVVRNPAAGAPSTVANVLWFVLAGLWIALAHLFLGVLLCLTIIGIPLGLGNFKLAAVAIAPLGKEIVPSSDPRAQVGAVVF